MKHWFIALLCLVSTSLFAQTDEGRKAHAYAFDQPDVLAAQRVFGIGNAVTMLGTLCSEDPAAHTSYAQWLVVNGESLRQLTVRLADYYQIPNRTDDLQQRVAATMHLKASLSLSESSKSDACMSLPETLALPSMDLAKRYQAILLEVKNPDYLKQKRVPVPTVNQTPDPEPVESSHDREEQTRSE